MRRKQEFRHLDKEAVVAREGRRKKMARASERGLVRARPGRGVWMFDNGRCGGCNNTWTNHIYEYRGNGGCIPFCFIFALLSLFSESPRLPPRRCAAGRLRHCQALVVALAASVLPNARTVRAAGGWSCAPRVPGRTRTFPAHRALKGLCFRRW